MQEWANGHVIEIAFRISVHDDHTRLAKGYLFRMANVVNIAAGHVHLKRLESFAAKQFSNRFNVHVVIIAGAGNQGKFTQKSVFPFILRQYAIYFTPLLSADSLQGARVGHHLSTCTFCGVGCGIYLETQGGEIAGVYPSMSHPANRGRFAFAGGTSMRLRALRTVCGRRLSAKTALVEVGFEEAYEVIARRLSQIKDQYGPGAIGFLSSARCGNEDGYLLQKLARAVVGTNNVDQGTNFYRAKNVDVLRRMLGVAAATNPIEDISCKQSHRPQ